MNRFIRLPFKTYAFLNGIEKDYSNYFFYSSFEEIKDHATKLNLLADMVLFSAKDDDFLFFLDGDAFPINSIEDHFISKIKNYKLVAIQRLENNGDIQPHPSFCATQVGFWKEIKGTWHKGYKWKDNQGDLVTDVGGNLLKILQDKHIDWYKMLRSNRKDIHPLAFGIYDNLIYHHALGFRNNSPGRISMVQSGAKQVKKRLDVKIMNRLIPHHWRFQGWINPYFRMRARLYKEFEKLNLEMKNKILKDEDFYKELM